MYELAPDKVQVPFPVLVSPPEVVAMAPANEFPVAVPSKVKEKVSPAIVAPLLNIIFPLLALIVADPPKVSAPLYVTEVAELFVSAPAVL